MRSSSASRLLLVLVGMFSASLVAAETAGRKLVAPHGPDHALVPAYERFFAAKKSNLGEPGRLLLGELNCTSCHALPGVLHEWVSVKKAPLLTNVGDRVRPQWIRDMLMNPQHVKPGTTRPDLFAGLSESDKRSRVEALTHFLASTATEALTDAYVDAGGIRRGEQLFHEVGCAACHNSQKKNAKPISFAMPLGVPQAKYTHASLAEFLRDPNQVRPSGRMPHMNLSEQDAADIASYFLRDSKADPNLRYKLYEGKWERLPDFAQLKPVAEGVAAGTDLSVAKLQNDYGLRFEGFFRTEKDGSLVFRLKSDDRAKLWIDDLLIVDYDGIHPAGEKEGKTQLKAGLHRVVIDYFQAGGGAELTAEVRFAGKQAWQNLASHLTLTAEPPKADEAKFRVDPQLAAEGRRLFLSTGCANCHELKENDAKLVSTLKPKALTDLRDDAGCLASAASAQRGNSAVPRYALSTGQVKALIAAKAWVKEAEQAKARPTSREIVAQTFAALNCYACHQRDGLGGVDPNKMEDLDDDGIPDRDPTSELLSPLFVGTTPEMGDEGRLPPKLDGVGAKLTEAYLKHVLDKGSKDRPYVRTMMPRFGGGNVLKLVPLLAELDKPIDAKPAELSGPPMHAKTDGRTLVGTKGLGCVKCHQFNKTKAEGIQGIDLTIVTKRVRPEWFVKYVTDPQSLRPGTRMPTVYPGGVSPLKDIRGGDPQEQIAAMWAFLADGAQAAVPYGVGGEPIELIADKEAVIYRNFIQDAGPRAIGVGYPAKVNLAFDANDLRPALIWHGAFIDAAKHWTGRGSGFQGPLGDDVVKLAQGPSLAKLGDAQAPWPTESARALGYKFLGYRLVVGRRPVFEYEFAGIEAADDFQPVAGPRPGLKRTIALTADSAALAANKGDELWLRAAVAKQIKPLPGDDKAGTWYEVDGLWRVRVACGAAQPIVRAGPLGQELLLPIALRAGTTKVTQEFAW